MKKITLFIISFLSFSFFQSQKLDTIKTGQEVKIDTIKFEYRNSEYRKVSNRLISQILQKNKVYKEKHPKDKSLEYIFPKPCNNYNILIVPIFDFKKSITNYKEGENLLDYVNFENNSNRQNIYVFCKEKCIYNTTLPNESLETALKNSSENLYFSEFSDPLNNHLGINIFDFLYEFRNNFIFQIEDKLCFLINGNPYVLNNNFSIYSLEDFRTYFLKDINSLKLKAQGKQNESFEEFKSNKFIQPKYLEIIKK